MVERDISMTTEQRIESVERFGYSRREAAFLVLAALHSGYFLRRQYCAYLGVGFGYPDDILTSKLLRQGHAREVSCDVQRLSRYRDARRRFGGALYDHLFGLRQANGVESIRRAASPESSPDLNRRCLFSALIPDQNYDLFGRFSRLVSERFHHKDAAQVSL